MKFKVMKILIILVTFAFITGCNMKTMTIDQSIDLAKETFEAGVISEPQQPNRETELFSYFLPSGLNVDETNENNLIISKGKQVYLIFSNTAEDAFSESNYEQDKVLEENTILIETLEAEESFSYLIITPFENDEYKIIVGIGGQKATTITDVTNFKDSIETMIKIINSIS